MPSTTRFPRPALPWLWLPRGSAALQGLGPPGAFLAATGFLSVQGPQNTFTNCSHVRAKVIFLA